MVLGAGSKLGPYDIIAAIGAGGMGEVYRARDPRVGREVAIKVSSEQFTDRFSREIRAVAALNNSNVATLYDVGPDYLVMELVEGPTLAERIRQGSIPLDESLEIARQIADALGSAHEKGIVHRDLKPANIKIKPDGTVKVLDFGLAKVGDTPAASFENSPTLSVAQTAGGMILGTAAYMSPEQARGKPVDKRAGIWAFGCVLYEMLTGKQLFTGETVSDILAAVLSTEPDWEKVPVKVRHLLRRCLAKDARQRVRDIVEAMAWIDSIPQAFQVKRPWLAWGGAAVFMLALAVPAFLYFREKTPVSAEPTCVQIGLPKDVSLASYPVFALSPDGRRLAFAAIGSDNINRLWIRPLDSTEARPLPGAELNSTFAYFFWSPDSRFIAFDAGRKLKKIDVTGGPAQTICSLSTNIVGGAWSRDGVIIFGANPGPLMRVSDKGGIPSPLTKLDSSVQERWHCLPAFLPDARHFFYFRTTTAVENGGIFIGSLDAKPEDQSTKRLMTTAWAGVYAPSRGATTGHLLFLREGVLMSQEFDEKRMELIGEPVSIAEKVGYYRSMGFMSVSANGVLAYRGSLDAFPSQATWFDRQGKILGKAGEASRYSGLRLSPDGGRAAVGSVNASKARLSADLWLLDFGRGTNILLTFGQSSNGVPIWSPDGTRIVFASDRDGGVNNLYQKTASGAKNEELLLKSGESKLPTSWSKDGRFLLYTTEALKATRDLWIVPMDGERTPVPFLRTEFNEFDGHFSPDGRWVAYTSDESGSNEIYVRGFSRTAMTASTEAGGRWLISRGGGTGPRWRGDGRELYYRAPDGSVMAVEVTAGEEIQAKTPTPLFGGPVDMMSEYYNMPTWDVAPTGNRFLLPVQAAEISSSPFTLILNWTALLKK